MPMREFVDSQGKRWTVWPTIPDWRVGVPTALHGGWLTFESGPQRRRLTPIPESWESASPAKLESLCGLAGAVPGPRASREVNPSVDG
jgi:hypothetical protein